MWKEKDDLLALQRLSSRAKLLTRFPKNVKMALKLKQEIVFARVLFKVSITVILQLQSHKPELNVIHMRSVLSL